MSHIVLDSEAKAREMIAVLRDDPDSFDEMAREHSIADTREAGGLIGKVLRGSLRPDVEAKVFHAAAGALRGHIEAGVGEVDRPQLARARVHPGGPLDTDGPVAMLKLAARMDGKTAATARLEVIAKERTA